MADGAGGGESCVRCLRWFVFAFNLFFWVCGLGMLGVSLWLLFDTDVQTYMSVYGQMHHYYLGVYLLLVVGLLTALLGFLGCCGALRESPCLLTTFFIVLFVVFIVQLAAAVLAFTHQDEVVVYIDKSMYDTVYEQYGRTVSYTNMFDKLQKHLQCCGVHTYKDWLHSYFATHARSKTAELGIGSASVGRVPGSCCNERGREEYPGSGDDASSAQGDRIGRCGDSFDKAPLRTYEPYLYTTGCSTALYNKVHKNLNVVIGFCVVVGIIELFGMIASMLLCCHIGRRNAEDRKTGGYY